MPRAPLPLRPPCPQNLLSSAKCEMLSALSLTSPIRANHGTAVGTLRASAWKTSQPCGPADLPHPICLVLTHQDPWHMLTHKAKCLCQGVGCSHLKGASELDGWPCDLQVEARQKLHPDSWERAVRFPNAWPTSRESCPSSLPWTGLSDLAGGSAPTPSPRPQWPGHVVTGHGDVGTPGTA